MEFFDLFHKIRNVGRWKLCGINAKISETGCISRVLGPKNHEIQSPIWGYILGEIKEFFGSKTIKMDPNFTILALFPHHFQRLTFLMLWKKSKISKNPKKILKKPEFCPCRILNFVDFSSLEVLESGLGFCLSVNFLFLSGGIRELWTDFYRDSMLL